MSSVRALWVAALIVVAASLAVAGPGLAGATEAGNLAAAGNTPTNGTSSGETAVTDGTDETGTTGVGNTSAPSNTTVDRNATDGGNTTADGNATVGDQSIERGPVRRPERRPRGPRVSPDVFVDDDGKAHYRTLAAAVEAAHENETILVRPGTYDGGVRVDVDGLTIAGVGPEEVELAGTGTGAGIVVAASDVTVRSVGVHGYGTGIAVEAGEGTVVEDVAIRNVTVEGVAGSRVRIRTDGPGARISNVTVESSELRLGGVVGWSGGNASSAGNGSATANHSSNAAGGSKDGNEGSATAAGTEGNATAGGKKGSASAAALRGPVTGVAVESPAGSVADVRVADTAVTDLGTGMRLAGPNGSVSGVRVVGSDFSGNDRGIDVADGTVHSVEVGGTDLVDNGVGLLVRAPTDASAVTVRGSRFSDNDVGLWSRAAGTLDAEGNGWGAPSGPDAPGNPDGEGDVVRGGVDADPWLPPTIRLEDAAVSGGRLTVALVAHAAGLSGYQVALSYGPARVDDVAVEGGAMPASLEVDGDVLVVSGSTEEPVVGPVVLATIEFEGDPEAVADALGLRGERSAAYDGTGRELDAAFLTGDLSVDVGETTPGATPTPVPATETPTAVPTTEPPTAVPATEPPTTTDAVAATTEGTPTGSGTPTATAESPDDERRGAASGAPNGEVERSSDGPDPLESIAERLSVVGDALSMVGELLRSILG